MGEECSSLSWLCVRILAHLFELPESVSQALFLSLKHHTTPMPTNIEEALKLLEQERALRRAADLKVWTLNAELEAAAKGALKRFEDHPNNDHLARCIQNAARVLMRLASKETVHSLMSLLEA